MYRLELSIPVIPTSLNKELRRNRHAKNQTNSAWDMHLHLELKRSGGPRPPRAPLARAKLTLIRHSYRMLDFDGLVGSLKPIPDALVFARVLADDSWAVLGAWTAAQVFRPKKLGPLLEIIVEEVDAEG
jgi:hypothetical protein